MSAPQESTSRDKDYNELIAELSRLEQIADSWDEQRKGVLLAIRDSIDALHKEAFVQLIRIVKKHEESAAILQEAAGNEAIYGVLRHLGVLKASLSERLEAALESVRPFLAEHQGGVELVSIDDKESVSIRLVGSCSGCPSATLTLEEGVYKAIREYCPEIKNITQVKGGTLSQGGSQVIDVSALISPFAKKKQWVNAVSVDKIKENNYLPIEVAGKKLLLFSFNGSVTCFENFCAHMGMPLDGGMIDNDIITCPHHGFRYSLTTGECLTAPEIQLQKFNVRTVETSIQVRLNG